MKGSKKLAQDAQLLETGSDLLHEVPAPPVRTVEVGVQTETDPDNQKLQRENKNLRAQAERYQACLDKRNAEIKELEAKVHELEERTRGNGVAQQHASSSFVSTLRPSQDSAFSSTSAPTSSGEAIKRSPLIVFDQHDPSTAGGDVDLQRATFASLIHAEIERIKGDAEKTSGFWEILRDSVTGEHQESTREQLPPEILNSLNILLAHDTDAENFVLSLVPAAHKPQLIGKKNLYLPPLETEFGAELHSIFQMEPSNARQAGLAKERFIQAVETQIAGFAGENLLIDAILKTLVAAALPNENASEEAKAQLAPAIVQAFDAVLISLGVDPGREFVRQVVREQRAKAKPIATTSTEAVEFQMPEQLADQTPPDVVGNAARSLHYQFGVPGNVGPRSYEIKPENKKPKEKGKSEMLAP